MKQSEKIHQLTDKELKINLVLSQSLFIIIAVISSLFFFDDMGDWAELFSWNQREIIVYGVIPGLIIVGVDLILTKILPESAFDDGGINERIFKNQSIPYIFLITLFIAFSEEVLFRGVVQTVFGYLFASILFAVIHIRYLKKPVLFISVLVVSLVIGYIFLLTENLFVTITLHFIIDFLLGLYIRFKK